MVGVRSFVIASLAMVSGIAAAQFDGPAPLAWRWQQSSSVSPNGMPYVDGNSIYFNLGNRVYGIDKDSGNTRWKFPNGLPSQGTFRKSPIMVNGVLCVYNDNREVYGINPSSGELKWVYQAPFAITSQIVGAGNYVAFSMEGGNIVAVDTATGNAAYDSPVRILDGIRGPVYSDGKDTLAFFDNRGSLEGISVTSRKTAFNKPFGAMPADGSMTFAEGNYYVYSGAFMVCMNASTGNPRWQVPIPGAERMMFSPEVGGGSILAVSGTGNAYFFDMSGALKSKTPLAIGSQPSVKPTCVGKKFAVPTSNGSLQLISPSGTIDWQYYVRPMNEAARQAATDSSGAGGGTGKGSGGPSSGPGGFGNPGGGQGTSNNNSSNAESASTVVVTGPVAVAGHTLLVPAADASLLAFDLDNGVDMLGPEVKQVWPGPGELVSGKNGQEFIFKIEDQASGVNVSSVKLDIDGAPYNFDFGRDGYLVCQISQYKKNNMIGNGRHTMHIVARDWLGNETNFSITIRVDNSLAPLKRPGTEGTGTNPGGAGGKGKGGGGGGSGAGAG